MQLGMIGLGRMGANLVRRLMRDGHECVVYDVSQPTPSTQLAGEGATGAYSLDEFVAKLDARRAPCGSWCPAAFVERHRRRSWSRTSSRATSSSTAATRTTATTSTAPRALRAQGHPLRRRRHERRRVRPRARLLPDDRRRGRRRQPTSTRSSRPSRPGVDAAPRTPGPHRRPVDGRERLPALRAERRRPLREDGPQRHRVRDHGRVRRGPEHPAQRRRRQGRPPEPTPRPRRCATRSTTSTTSTSPRSPRCGGGAAWSRRGCSTSPRTRCRRIADARRLRGPGVRLAARVAGPSLAAIDEGVPADVLTRRAVRPASSSRGDADFADRLLSAMRKEFGGHDEKLDQTIGETK